MATPPTPPNPPDDPFAPSDATVLRPRPGRRPGSAQPGPVPSAGSQGLPPPPAPRYASASGPSVGEFVSRSGNPLVQAAVPLLVLAGRLRGQIANADVESVRRQCMQEVRAFEERVRQANVA